MTPQEINEAVARKLKGWFSNCKCEFPLKEAHHNCPGEFGNCHHADNCNLPDFCHSIAAAWEIVEHLKNHSIDLKLIDPMRGWFCSIFPWEGYPTIEAEAPTAPMAICLAFLKLKE